MEIGPASLFLFTLLAALAVALGWSQLTEVREAEHAASLSDDGRSRRLFAWARRGAELGLLAAVASGVLLGVATYLLVTGP